jgi:hypothetical protein
MNKIRIEFLLILLTPLFISCEKEIGDSKYNFNNCTSKCIEIHGRILDASDNAKIVGAEILLEYKGHSGLKKEIGKVKTSDNGEFDISFLPDSTEFEKGYYRIKLIKGGYLTKQLILNATNLILDSIYHTINYLIPEAQIKVILLNKSPFDENDMLSFNISYMYDKYKQYNNLGAYELTNSGGGFIGNEKGKEVNSFKIYSLPSGEIIKIKYSITKNSIESSFHDSILLHAGNITDYKIYY